jgi:HEAT repeat protein
MFLNRKISNLEKALAEDNTEGVRRAVKPLLVYLSDRDEKVRTRVADKLVKSGEVAVEPLIACLKTKGVVERHCAAEALAKLGDPQAAAPLIALLTDHDWYVRSFTAEALGRLGDQRAVEPLIARLKDQERSVRSSAARAVGMLNDTRAVEPLLATLNDPYVFARTSAAEALGELGDARAVEPLTVLLKDQEPFVRNAATEALRKLGDARDVDPFIAVKDQRRLRQSAVTSKLADASGSKDQRIGWRERIFWLLVSVALFAAPVGSFIFIVAHGPVSKVTAMVLVFVLFWMLKELWPIAVVAFRAFLTGTKGRNTGTKRVAH